MTDEHQMEKGPEYVSNIQPMIADLLGGYENPAFEWDQDEVLEKQNDISFDPNTTNEAV